MQINKQILTSRQLTALEILSKDKFIENFYLSGGTALVGFYSPYSYSDDLVFFLKMK